MLYLFNIQDTINEWISAFTSLPWYIHMVLGAVATILVLILLKWLAYKLKGLVLALKIFLVIALLVTVLIYFIIK